jgi:OTT_1508-like deaminase
MVAWLSSFKDHKEDMLHLCRFSYDARASPYMKELTRRSEKGSALACMVESKASTFLKVRHLVGRLGSHMKAAKTLVAAATRFPAFFDDFEIKCLPSPKPAETPPRMNKMKAVDQILARMLPQNHKDLPIYQAALRDMNTKFNLKIFKHFVDQYKQPTFLPRVHAELILLEHFHTNQYTFVDGDRYIGCSKPACYCCYHYICAHPGNFVRPASHNKIYLNWRPPDVVDEDEDGSEAKRQRDIINDMVKMIRKDVLAQIDSQRGRRPLHPDSTTGITASIVVEGSGDLLNSPETPGLSDTTLDYSSSSSAELDSDIDSDTQSLDWVD